MTATTKARETDQKSSRKKSPSKSKQTRLDDELEGHLEKYPLMV
jgi:hypothetical protein